MTREEAINKWIIPAIRNTWNHKKCQEILKALAQEFCEEAISRQAVLDLCDSKDSEYKVRHFKEDVECLPPVMPQHKIGHWIKYGVPRCGEQHYKCTACDDYINFGVYSDYYLKAFKYCPNCGAKMQEVEE